MVATPFTFDLEKIGYLYSCWQVWTKKIQGRECRQLYNKTRFLSLFLTNLRIQNFSRQICYWIQVVVEKMNQGLPQTVGIHVALILFTKCLT